MNIRNKFLPMTAASAVIFGAAVSAQADPTVNLQLLNTGTYAVNQSVGTYAGSPMGVGNVGIYSFKVTSSSSPGTTGLTVGSTIYSVCLSPLGDIPGGSALYTVESFAQANAGLNPALWAWNHSVSTPQYWGIENADYLWRDIANAGQGTLGGMSLLSSALKKDAGAALALAMYTVLYDSTGYGTYTPTASNYKPPTLAAGPELTDYMNDLAVLSPGAVEANIASGSVLVPSVTSGQDLIYVNPSGGKLNPPVPEPTTMVAGVLLALPFGASTLRILRKKTIA